MEQPIVVSREASMITCPAAAEDLLSSQDDRILSSS
jgi:hypothetical protein